MEGDGLLDRTLELLEREGPESAYRLITAHAAEVPGNELPQLYNFRYCLAAQMGEAKTALSILAEAVFDRGFWYRPEVFDDPDLSSLREHADFRRCRESSLEMYERERRAARTLCSWYEKRGESIALALHGNQQDGERASEDWRAMTSLGYQLESLQSRELDSHGSFRWEDDGDGAEQLAEACGRIRWNEYRSRCLCGFSAGCNVILKALAHGGVRCETAILQSPWIPMLEGMDADGLFRNLVEGEVSLLVICGTEDRDCFGPAQGLVDKARERGADCQGIWIEGMGHRFPGDLGELLSRHLAGP